MPFFPATRATEHEQLCEWVDAQLVNARSVVHGLTADQIVSVILTATPDLTSAFPAAGAREFGLTDVPLLCAQEIDVAGALPRVVRILMHAELEGPRSGIAHVYLRGAEVLRQDLVQ